MRRRFSAVLWLGISLICGAAGCSGDPVSSAVAVRSQNDDRDELTGTSFDAANADMPQAVESGGLVPAARETVVRKSKAPSSLYPGMAVNGRPRRAG